MKASIPTLLPLLLLGPGSVAQAAELRFGAGLHLGTMLPLNELGVGFHPRLELSAALPVAEGRLRPVLTFAWSQMAASGEGADARVGTGSYEWALRESVFPLALGLTVRPLKPKVQVQPEITLAPEIVWMSTASTGSADGAEFGVTHEHSAAVGLFAAAGAAIELGPGEAVGAVAFTTVPLQGALTGEEALSALTPTLGYRLWF